MSLLPRLCYIVCWKLLCLSPGLLQFGSTEVASTSGYGQRANDKKQAKHGVTERLCSKQALKQMAEHTGLHNAAG